MRYSTLLLIVSLCALAPQALAQENNTAAKKSVSPSFNRTPTLPKWAQPLAEMPESKSAEPIVVRLDETQAVLSTNSAYLINRAIQVNEKNSLAVIGQFGIDYYPIYQKLAVHRISLIRDAKVVDRLSSVSIRHLQRETSMESGMYGGATTVQFLMDDVRVGDTLWITYTVEGENPVFEKKWSSEFHWDRNTPIEKRRVTILHPKNRPVYWKQLGDFKTTELKPQYDQFGDTERIRFEENDIEPIESEPSIPSDYIPVRVLQFSEYKNWHEVAVWAEGLFPKVRGSIELKKLAQQFGQKKTPMEQVSEALHWVQNEVRYFSVSMGENSHRPQLPDVVLKKRYGDCKDKSYLLVSLLNELGIEAQPILLSAHAGKLPAKTLAAPSWFDHVIVAVKIEGKLFYVDPTVSGQNLAVDKITPPFPDAKVLAASASANALQTLPSRVIDLVLVEEHMDITIPSANSDAILKATNIYRGEFAEWARQNFPSLSSKELKRSVLMQFEKQYPGISLNNNIELKDNRDENQFAVSAELKLPNPLTKKGSQYEITYESKIFQNSLGIPEKITRNFPLELPNINYHAQYYLEIHWPDTVRDYKTPVAKVVRTPFFDAYEETAFMGNTRILFTDFKVKRNVVEAELIPAMQKEARELNPFGTGEFSVAEEDLQEQTHSALSYRELDTMQLIGLIDTINKTEMHLDNPDELKGICHFFSNIPYLADFMGEDTIRRNIELEKTLITGKLSALKKCIPGLTMSRGDFQDTVTTIIQDKGNIGDESQQKDLAWAYFYLQKNADAIKTLSRSFEGKENANKQATNSLEFADALALYQRSKTDTGELIKKLRFGFDKNVWPYSIIAMQLNEISIQELISSLQKMSPSSKEIASSDAWYYIGQKYMAMGEPALAKEAYSKVIESGIRSSSSYRYAQIEMLLMDANEKDYFEGNRYLALNQYDKAVNSFRASAASGFIKGKYELGKVYYFGDYGSTRRNYDEAFKLFEEAANAGHPGAENFLGNMYLDGKGVKVDRAKSIVWYMKAAAAGDKHGHYNLGNAYLKGTPLPQDNAQAFAHYLIAAEKGHEKAQAELAILYANGEGTKLDFHQAYRWSLLASLRGEIKGLLQIAALYATGNGVKKDGKRAISFYEEAVSQGSTQAMFNLGALYQNGFGVEVDHKLAFEWYQKAVSKGHIEAMAALGYMYQYGLGVQKYEEKAASLYKSGAMFGSPEALYRLGLAHKEGMGTTLDTKRAVEYLLLAATKAHKGAIDALENGDENFRRVIELQQKETEERDAKLGADGDAPTLYDLGLKYNKGRGVKKNYLVAATFYNKAADLEYPLAQNNLGDMYELGQGLPIDYEKAISLYKKAANAEHYSGFNSLASMYERGVGMKKNPYLAYVYYTIASKLRQSLYGRSENIANLLTREQIEKAEAVAGAWKKGMLLPTDED